MDQNSGWKEIGGRRGEGGGARDERGGSEGYVRTCEGIHEIGEGWGKTKRYGQDDKKERLIVRPFHIRTYVRTRVRRCTHQLDGNQEDCFEAELPVTGVKEIL